MIQPYFMTEISSIGGRAGATLGVSVICCMIFLGQFCVTYFIAGLSGATGGDFRAIFTITGVVCIACAVFALIYNLATKKAVQETVDEPEEASAE